MAASFSTASFFGERETGVTSDEAQWTMGKRKKEAVLTFRLSFARKFSSIERRLGARQVQAAFGCRDDECTSFYWNV